MATFLLWLCGAHVAAASSGLSKIYKSSQVKDKCGGSIGAPDLIYTGQRVFAVAGCHGSGLGDARRNISAGLADDVQGHSCIMKSSGDNGESWDSWTVLTPPKRSGGYGACKAVFDTVRSTMLVQYAYFPAGTSSRPANVQYFQKKCSASGSCQAETEITASLAACNGNTDDMVSGMAGNRIQLSTGRILFGGAGAGGHACIWYSDDGGSSWHSTWNTGLGQVNEFSLVETGGVVIMNGRKRNDVSGWPTDHRAIYRSTDHGVTWTGPVADSTLLDSVTNAGHGTEASIIYAPGGGKYSQPALIFFNPHHSGRTNMHVQCSLDGHKTWPKEYKITGMSEGGYSSLIYLPDRSSEKILLAWEADNGNTWIDFIGRGWCESSLDGAGVGQLLIA